MSVKLGEMKRSFENAFKEVEEKNTIKFPKVNMPKFEKCLIQNSPREFTKGGDLTDLINNVNGLNITETITP